MPRGGARIGTGGPQPGSGRPRKQVPPVSPPRPEFATAREFGVWALNAGDVEVSMDQKIRAMQVLAMIETKQAAPATQPKATPGSDAAEGDAPGRYSPRRVRGFGVVEGGR